MIRILRGLSSLLSVEYKTGTTVLDPGTVTVEILRDDGTVLVAANTATGGSGAGPRTYSLTNVNTASLDILTARWTSATLGLLTTKVEIVGGFMFSVDDLANLSLGGTKTIGSTFDVDELHEMRTTVEDTLEQATGRAFVPRYKRVKVRGARWAYGPLNMRQPDLRAVRWITSAGTAISPSEVASLTYDDLGYVYGLTLGRGRGVPVIAGIEYGMDEPPPRVRAAALLLARTWIVKGPVDDRVTTMSSPETGITASLATPGRGGSIVGVPEVDQVIHEYRMPNVA